MEFAYIGNYSAVDPPYSRHMKCYECKICWTGCWDNFECPKCGHGDLPSVEGSAAIFDIQQPHGAQGE
jgi:hypothetical protein